MGLGHIFITSYVAAIHWKIRSSSASCKLPHSLIQLNSKLITGKKKNSLGLCRWQGHIFIASYVAGSTDGTDMYSWLALVELCIHGRTNK